MPKVWIICLCSLCEKKRDYYEYFKIKTHSFWPPNVWKFCCWKKGRCLFKSSFVHFCSFMRTRAKITFCLLPRWTLISMGNLLESKSSQNLEGARGEGEDDGEEEGRVWVFINWFCCTLKLLFLKKSILWYIVFYYFLSFRRCGYSRIDIKE